VTVLDKGRKSLAQSARTGKQIDDAESGWQIRLLTKSIQPVYTRFEAKGQEANGGYRRQQTRSRMMAGIRGKDTKPELVLRRALHARGFRYRLHG
jgi:hypothetical protein